MEAIQHLQGMADVPEAAWVRLQDAKERFRQALSLYGYRMLETPVLEATELFLRKGGGELATRMYAFTDQGGSRVSLRPEYTASVVRHYLECEGTSLLPLRFVYAGPVFRYQAGQELRQFTQVGAELIGSSSAMADAEVLEVAAAALAELGLKDCSLALGDVGLFTSFLSTLGLSERAKSFILGSIVQLGRGPEGRRIVRERAQQRRLLSAEGHKEETGLASLGLEPDATEELLSQLLQRVEGAPLGQRSSQSVVDRLLRKLQGTDQPARIEQALEVSYQLAQVRGEPAQALVQARDVMQDHHLDIGLLARLEQVVELLDCQGPSQLSITIDLSLARDISYYTGIVFEAKHLSSRLSLGGGGRYDTLVKTLGGASDVPALGFAFVLERLVQLTGSKKEEATQNEANGVLLLSAKGTGWRAAKDLASKLRSEGCPVEMDVMARSLKEALAYARSRGLAEVAVVESGGRISRHKVQTVSESSIAPPRKRGGMMPPPSGGGK